MIDVAPGKDNEADIIRILANIRGAIKITQSLLMSSTLSDDTKEDLLTKFSSKCSQSFIPALEKIQDTNAELKISETRLINNRIVLEILSIIIQDSKIFDTLDSYKLKIWVLFLLKLMKESFSYNVSAP